MTEPDATRIVAWNDELRRVHARLRQALAATRETADARGTSPDATRDLLVFCRGFCAALDAHHRGENRTLFPAIEAAHPDLTPTLRQLQQDHSMIDHLITGLAAAVDRAADPAELDRHLDGIGAIMENHFRYEERALDTVLERLGLVADPAAVLGPL